MSLDRISVQICTVPLVGEQTLVTLVKEYHAKGPVYRRHVHTLLRSSYSHHYRVMLPPILDALTFRSNNTVHQPIIKALVWLKANRNSYKQFIACDKVPIDSVVRLQLQELLLESDPQGDQHYLVKMLQSDDHATAQYALVTLKKGNVPVWRHILLHGEYDLSRKNIHDDFGLADPKIITIIYTGFWEYQKIF